MRNYKHGMTKQDKKAHKEQRKQRKQRHSQALIA